jgi:integration host factor subunit alpha
LKIGLEGKLRQAMPNQFLRPMLIKIAETLGPLPHARLNIERGRDNRGPADRPKKQKTRYLKGTCTDPNCGYSLRIDDLAFPEARRLVDAVLEEMIASLALGENLKLPNFGVFVVHEKGKRLGRNPHTKVPTAIAPRKSITFKASPDLKARVAGKARRRPERVPQAT